MILRRMLTNDDNDARRFVSLVMMAAADFYRTWPGEMLGQGRIRAAVQARHAACEVLRRHMAQETSGDSVSFRILESMGMEHYPVSYPSIGFLFCRDHTAFVQATSNPPSADAIDEISRVAMAAWPAVRDGGMLAGVKALAGNVQECGR